MSLNPFNKSELFIHGLVLERANLDQIACAVAQALALPEQDVLVVDAREDLLTLDVLNSEIPVERIAGRAAQLLEAIARVPGVRVLPGAEIHSEGVLGLVNLPAEHAATLPAAMSRLDGQIRANVARRAMVLPTGSEIIGRQIEDTNTPYLVQLLRSEGYAAEAGPAVPDDLDSVIGALSEASLKGYGLVVTTGGTGAESKDHVVEAILALDPQAATPYVVHYHRGQGRHAKDGVRLAVGTMELTTFIALTGPHREVQLVAPAMVRGLKDKAANHELAEHMANLLRAELMGRHHGGSSVRHEST